MTPPTIKVPSAANDEDVSGDDRSGGVASGGGPPHDGGMEQRIQRLETDMADVKQTLGRLEPTLVRIDERLSSSLPTLATKAELANKPSHGYLWAVLGVLVALTFGAVTLGAFLMS